MGDPVAPLIVHVHDGKTGSLLRSWSNVIVPILAHSPLPTAMLLNGGSALAPPQSLMDNLDQRASDSNPSLLEEAPCSSP